MYSRYNKVCINSTTYRFNFIENVSLFGNKNGYIPWILKDIIAQYRNKDEPFRWHINIDKDLNATYDYKDSNSCLVIDLKPKQSKDNLSLYEVLDIWGYSSSGWTPIMLLLKGLFIDEDPNNFDRDAFTIDNYNLDNPIYEFLYLDGSVENGELVGKWTAPPVSPTNAVLLFPDTLNYFFNEILKKTPNILNH